MILADSSAWIAYFNGDAGRVAAALDAALSSDERVCVLDLIVTEVLQGFRSDRDFELARRTLSGLDRIPLFLAVHVNAAKLYRRLRSGGVTPKTIDCIVAQACLESGAALLTADTDFHAIARRTRLRLVA